MADTLDPMFPASSRQPKVAKLHWQQCFAAVVVSFGALSAGSVLSWTSPVLPQLTAKSSTIHVTVAEATWIGSLLAIGALCSAVPAGILVEKFGRKFILIGTTIPFLINWILIVFAVNVYMLYVARFLAGISTGAICVCGSMYLIEMSEIKNRGTYGSFFQLFLCIGILITYSIGALVHYKILSLILAIFPICFGIGFNFLPESPVYLIKNNRLTAASDALRWLRPRNHDIEKELSQMQVMIEARFGRTAKFMDLFQTRENIYGLIACIGLMCIQQLSGVSAIKSYTVQIFQAANTSIDEHVQSILVALVQVIMAVVCSSVIERAGRKFFLMISGIIMAVCMILLGFYFQWKLGGRSTTYISWLPLFSLMFFIVGYAVGLGPLPWMLMSEIYSPELRGIASGITVTLNWALVFIVTKSFGPLVFSIGPAATFYIFAAFLSLGIVFIVFCVPETRGKSMQQIQKDLRKINFKKF
ncbi:facilitated trehalose transporter Tret1-like [Chrysoperla carnea]|uniref:facilitated trehalose transporter Tret1-like n=1 Tax=Chrysoperla carnea TaxID=189513 RepID=UPI001D06AAF1|nr:facilitated trehalose transporter Tret1-like [Chrysoperla carnea]